ncbi:TPA: TRAP transporter substrate-binding protein DctP [Citrobacter koseri]
MLTTIPGRKCIAVLFAMLMFPGAPSAAQTLIYSDHEPLGGMRTRFINDVFFPAIEKESRGRLKVEAHWGGELSDGYTALAMVGKGDKADMAVVVPEYAAEVLPLQQIFKSFPVGPAGEKQVAFFRRVYADIPDFSAELKKENVVNVFIATGYPLAFFSTTALSNPEGLKGGTWRSASFWHQGFLKNVGAKAVTMPWGDETYKALQSGSLDGLMLNVDSGYALNAQRFAPDVLVSRDLWLGHVYLLVMNKNTWDNLSRDDRTAIQRAADVAYQSLGSVMDKSFTTQVADLEKSGATVRILHSEDVAQWKAATRYQEIQSEWVKEQEKNGLTEAGRVMKQVSSILDEMMSPAP